jgi:hypothetical protein
MALLNSTKALEHLIPSPGEKFYDSLMQRVPDSVVNETPIYAIAVSGTTKRVISIYRVAFVLFSSDSSNYLFIGDLTKELTSSTYFVSAKASEGKKVKIEDWGFEKDDIGLYIITGNISKDKIYFATSFYDAREVREKLMEEKLKEKHKVTLVAETVYV